MRLYEALLLIIGFLGVILVIFPFIQAIRVSLTPATTSYIVDFFAPISFENYVHVLGYTLFPRWVVNTLIVAVAVSLTNMFFCLLAGYVLARGRMPFTNALTSLTIVSMSIPQFAIIVPIYFIMANLKLTNNLFGLILPLAVDPMGIFIMSQYIKTLPVSYEEAAMLDGYSELDIIWKIILPLSKPALVVLFATEFINAWNNFIYPLILINNEQLLTVTVGISNFRFAVLNVNWGATMAASLISALPPVIFLILLSNRLIKGFMLGGLKGT